MNTTNSLKYLPENLRFAMSRSVYITRNVLFQNYAGKIRTGIRPLSILFAVSDPSAAASPVLKYRHHSGRRREGAQLGGAHTDELRSFQIGYAVLFCN